MRRHRRGGGLLGGIAAARRLAFAFLQTGVSPTGLPAPAPGPARLPQQHVQTEPVALAARRLGFSGSTIRRMEIGFVSLVMHAKPACDMPAHARASLAMFETARQLPYFKMWEWLDGV